MRLTVQPLQWISAGLLCATATGMAAWLFGYPFLSTHFRYLDLPIIGAIPMASALLFDIGVFARSEEHTSELQSLMRLSYAVFCLKKKTHDLNTLREQYSYNIIDTIHNLE